MLLTYKLIICRILHKKQGEMSMNYDVHKLIDILVILSKNNQELTKLRIHKLLYLIDKFHLRDYSRIVLNDKYVALSYGPVAQKTRDILDDFIEFKNYFPLYKSNFEKNHLDKYFDLGKDKHGYDKLVLKKESDLKTLSESEKIIINKVIKSYGNYTTGQLVNVTHRDEAWKKTGEKCEIDYKLLLVDLPSEKRKVMEELIEIDEENDLIAEELNR